MDLFHTCKREKKPRPNLLPAPPYCHKLEECENESVNLPLAVSDPGNLLLLMESLIDNNTLDLEKKLNCYIQEETCAEIVFITTILYVTQEAVVKVVGDQVLKNHCTAPIDKCALKNIKTQSTLNGMKEFDEMFENILCQVLGTRVSCAEIVTVPVFSKHKKEGSFTVPVLVSLVNSNRCEEFVTKVVHETYRFCLPILTNTVKLEEEAKIKRQCQSLLSVARKLFNHLHDLNDLLKEIMAEARKLTNAERCSLFLLDPDHLHLVAKVFDGIVRENITTEVRIAKDQGIAGHVAVTGKLLNIKDAYNHPLFYKGMDETTGFRTRNILCFPIRDEKGIIGVAQLCNKNTGDFNFFDEEVALAFSIYCGISIQHSLMYKRMQEATHRSKLSNELMLYHMKVPQEDVRRVLLCTKRHEYLEYTNFNFSPKRIRDSETTCHIIRIFEDLNFFEKFRIKREVFAKFILYVKKGYRDMSYHNWMHAFSVTHFAYTLIKQLNLIEEGCLTDLEAMSYLMSCICHDIDHRGTTNSFQNEIGSIFASLYSSEGSVMERHHLSQSLCILNTNDCNFLESLTYDEYTYFLALMKDNILATDLANHFKLLGRQKELIDKGISANCIEDKYVLLCLLMNCADLSDQTKTWDVIKKVAQQIYDEFFCQGDLEKAMGKEPHAMMNREEASIPDLQTQFLSEICLPIFNVLASLFPDAIELVNNINRNISCWTSIKPVFERLGKLGLKPLEILNSDELDQEVRKILNITKEEEESEAEEEEIDEKEEVEQEQEEEEENDY